MLKIGIATPYRIANYGTKLQAFALETYLNSFDNVDAEIIKYQPNLDRRFATLIRKAFSISRNVRRIKKLINKMKIGECVDPSFAAIRDKAINQFNSKLTFSEQISSYTELVNFQCKYNCIVCGSDQIWIPENIKDGYYTLGFVKDGIYKGSYAASLGVGSLSDCEKKQYFRFLARLDFISVREESGKNLLLSFFDNKEIEWVCDPTFLIDVCEWRKLESRPKVLDEFRDNYIFCYFIGTNEEHRETVFNYAKDHNLKVLSIANFRGYCEADTRLSDYQLYDLTVNEFLYLIDNASMVCTDSMHATIFSIILESNFWTFERFKKDDQNSRNSRIYSLLNVMGLGDRLVSDFTISGININFESVRPNKEKYINYSKDYIKNNILDKLV